MKMWMKKIALFLVGCSLVGTLTGCGGLDFSAYLKALLDSHYLNDSTDYVKLGIGTAEESEANHANHLEEQIDLIGYFEDTSEETRAEYLVLLDEMMSKAKYTVGETTEIDETTVGVAVTYETFLMYSPGVEAISEWLMNEMIALVEETGGYVTEQEIVEWSAYVFMQLTKEGLEKSSYTEPKTMTIRIELVDDIWTPNPDDFTVLDDSLFNYDQLLADLEAAYIEIIGFDASAYMQAILDMFFKGETEGFVAEGIGTEEDALAIYNGNLDAQIENLSVLGKVSEEVAEGYRQSYGTIYENLKYEVGEAVQIDDDTYEVVITYEKMYVMDKVTPAFREGIMELSNEWSAQAKETGSAPSGDEMADQMFKLQLKCMDAAMSQVTYDEAEEFVISIEWSEEEQMWIPNVDQYIELEYCLLDFENMRLSY